MNKIKDIATDLINMDPILINEFAMIMNKNNGELPELAYKQNKY